jgi:hypothetical protein
MSNRRLWRNGKAIVAVGVLVLFVVAGAAYIAFVDQPEPVEVSNAKELGDVRNDLDGDYVLVDGIDLSQEVGVI